jgi:hypothetical protein
MTADDELDRKDTPHTTCCALVHCVQEEHGAYPAGPRHPFSRVPLFLLDRSHIATTHQGARRSESAAVFLGNRLNLGGDIGPKHERRPVSRGDAQRSDAFWS